MRRAAIYARFSSDLQSDRSIDDQIAVCRDYDKRNGMVVVMTFEDHAISGASMFGRDGMRSLLDTAKAGAFDVVVAESMSRLGRDQEDRAAIRKRLKFCGIEIATPADGIVSPLVDGIRAVIDSQYLDDLKRATHRGMQGAVREGRLAGGNCYGYAPVPGKPGERTIVEAEAVIVQRVFAAYLAGQSPRHIAVDLNRDGVPAPRGGVWGASTIHGSPKRGNGILTNPLYSGRIVWNRLHMLKDPDTGRRVSRENATDQHHVAEVPALRIIDETTWRAAQAIKAGRANGPQRQTRRPQRLLSGLIRCPHCGGSMIVAGGGKNGRGIVGRPRIQCSAKRQSGTCPGASFPLEPIERMVIDGLNLHVEDERRLAIWVKAYNDERARLAGRDAARLAKRERRLGEIERELNRLVDHIAKGINNPDILAGRINELDAERRAIKTEQAAEPPPKAIALHPAALDHYRRQIDFFLLAKHADQIPPDKLAAVRDLIGNVTPSRNADGSIAIKFEGRLGALIRAVGAESPTVRSETRMVAGIGLEPTTYGL